MKPSLEIIPSYYHTYVEKIPDSLSLSNLLDMGKEATLEYYAEETDQTSNQAYEVGKWTKKEVLIHLNDCERIFANRALRIARGDKTPLPGFDQNEFMKFVDGNDIPLERVIEDYFVMRQSTQILLRNLSKQSLAFEGTASGFPVHANSIFWIIVGHEIHHLEILKERY